MRRLPGILLLTGATLIVIAALLASGLRLVLPHLDTWREPILAKISAEAGVPISASKFEARWQNFGLELEVRDIKAKLNDGGDLSVKRLTLALDVWQSLLHLRWQFRDLTFYQLVAHSNTPLQRNDGEPLGTDRISDLFLRQFDHFDLRDSRISFLTLSGQRAELAIPQLTWLNGQERHRAEGQVSLSSLTGQHGIMQVRMDLRDDNGLLNNGRVWLQADDIDVKPWLNKWMQDNVALESARFSLEGWMTLNKGEIESGDVWLKKGGASWQGNNNATHRMTVDNLTTHISRQKQGWQFDVPVTNIAIDDKPWPQGALSFAWVPAQEVGGADNQRSDELRIRASNLELGGLEGLMPIAQKISPTMYDIWNTMQPGGRLEQLALDIPLKTPEKTRFQAHWQDISWRQWKLLPGVEHLSGTLEGSIEDGRLTADIAQAKMPYETVFRAPLEIEKGVATLNWQKNTHGFQLDGHNIDVQATGLRARGDFRYLQPQGAEPWLGILAGINVSDAGQAWRYFPENLMGKALVDYLSGAIQGGQTENATLVYSGNPHLFPYKHNEGQFEVLVPLRNATFAFQPDWPALQNLDIELDFLNDGLWMKSDKVALGGVTASNLAAAIPDYIKEKLIIDADINGPGKAVGPYFKETPLHDTLGSALDELQIDGDVSARLHLDIPLDGEMTLAKGDVTLNNNALFIKPLNSTLKNLSGKFSFENGNLKSEPLQAIWFNQPLNVNFSTTEGEKEYQVAVNLDGNWQPSRTGVLPAQLNDALRGSVAWKGDVGITLPHNGGAAYKVNIDGDLNNIASTLPPPLDKPAGKALPVKVNVSGNLHSFDLTGNAGGNHHFNSRWLLSHKLTLDRGIWASDSKTTPPLPEQSGLELNLPPMNGAQWLALFKQGAANDVSNATTFPTRVTLRTPALTLAGQQWNNLSIVSQPQLSGTTIEAQSREISGTLTVRDNAPWQAAIRYLYYNPSSTAPNDNDISSPTTLLRGQTRIDFTGWPDLQLRCQECWLWGQKYGRIDGDFAINGDTLRLDNGLIDSGFARLTADGEWVNREGAERTSIKGVLRGAKLDSAMNFFGVPTPVRDSSFNINYDLHWRSPPWQPQEESLNGILRTRLGKGQITDISTGHAGQLLRLFSVDSLLRKLRFDFSDTFSSEGFWFDSIRSTAWIKDGVLHSDDTLVDGLEADIAMKGSVNLVRRELDVEAVVAPEISATVGVAAAFAVNPIVGAAVFAASKVLGPLWNKVSILRYRITGPVDQPQINEVLRQPRTDKRQ
ncbi:AsmA2 domain-containing protein YhdP [Kosakonia sp. H02]|nr:AsmA2 domain-containing protein YhdP [Kosakonia sp. H02]